METQKYYIGIDPGIKTGIALWNAKTREFEVIMTTDILAAMTFVRCLNASVDVTVVFSDCRWARDKETHFACFVNNSTEEDKSSTHFFVDVEWEDENSLDSAKQECDIWESFLKVEKIKYDATALIYFGEILNATEFKKLVGWNKQTTQHDRNAAMLVFNKK